ncbi:hypothetical protein [Nonomuraea polychroma]|nr:hypothetical protein [Nonomuraea polychroma]
MASRELQRREESHGWLPYSFATVGNESYVSATREADAQFKTVGSIPADLVSYIRHDSLISPPHRILGSILTLAEILREGVVLPQPAGMILAADTLVALLVSALRSARRLDQLGPDGMRREIEDGLATGNPHDRSIIRIVDLADRLLREQIATLQKKYASAGAQPVEHYTPSLREHVTFTPDWLTRFYDLSERLWHRPDLARELPQTVDLICYDALLGNSNWKSQAFSHLFSLEHRQLLVVAVDTLRAAAPELASYLSGILDISFNMAPVPPRNVVRRNPLIKDSNEGDDGDGTQQELPV